MKRLIGTLAIFTLLFFKLNAQSCFNPVWEGNGYNQMNFYITSATINGINMVAGDEIGIFDGTYCVGVGVLTQALIGGGIYLSIITSEDSSPIDGLIDGFIGGNSISYKLCIYGGATIITNVQAAYSTGNGTFIGKGTAVVNLSGFTVPPSAPVVGTISQPTCSVGEGSVVLNGLPGTGTWTLTRNPGGITTTGTGENTTIIDLASGTYTYTVTDYLGATSDPSTNVVINDQPTAPGPAGTITGTATVCQDQTSVGYNVPAITNADTYTWAYDGTGATITGNTNAVTISFAANATSGNLTVYGVNACGNGTISTNYAITVNPLPVAAGTITGTATVCQGQGTVAYSVPAITNATSYTGPILVPGRL